MHLTNTSGPHSRGWGKKNGPGLRQSIILYQWDLPLYFSSFPAINRCAMQSLHTHVSPHSWVGPAVERHTAAAECRASSPQLDKVSPSPKPAFLISFRWQGAFPREVQISRLRELGTHSWILDCRHEQGTTLNSSSRAGCLACPLHREVGAALRCCLAPGSATYSRDAARRAAQETTRWRATVQTILCGWLVTWRRLFITML